MMLIKRCVGLLLSTLVVITVSGQSERKAQSETLFSVNNKTVPTDEFIYLYRKNHQHKPEEFTEEKIDEYLKLFIHYKLKVEEAFYRGLDTTASFKKEYNTYRDELLKPYLPDAKVVDSLVALTYDRLREDVNASHILVSVEPDATPADTMAAFKKIMGLRAKIIEGENFGQVATAHSEEPGAATTKGNLGYFTAMQMVFPFEQAAYTTPVGQVSQPVRTRFGYHILFVHNKQPSRGEVEVSHIMIRTGEAADNEAVKNTIFDIYDQLQKGVNWEELCAEHSEDPNSKDQGGRLRPFGVAAMASAPPFEEVAFGLQKKGDISDPFQTAFGWHILRLESKIPLPPFEELKTSLTNRVSRDERVQISRQALRNRMKSELGYSENLEVKAKLLSLADSALADGKLRTHLAAVDENAILFTMRKQAFRVKDFLDYVSANPPLQGVLSEALIEQLLVSYADAAQMQLLEDRIKKESPDYKWLLKEYYEGILLFEIMEKEVWNKATEDSVGQRDYYAKNQSKFIAQDRIDGMIYASTSKSALAELQALLASGDSSVQQYISSNKIRQEAGSFEKDDRPVLSKIDWSPGFQTAENNGMNYLIFIKKILPPGQKTFEEARSTVISDYQTYLEESWIAELRKKFKVVVSRKAKKRAFEQLIK